MAQAYIPFCLTSGPTRRCPVCRALIYDRHIASKLPCRACLTRGALTLGRVRPALPGRDDRTATDPTPEEIAERCRKYFIHQKEWD